MSTQFMSPSAYMPAPPAMSYNGYPTGRNGGFSFRKRVERMDWRKIASVDIDHISRTLDFTTLQENIMNITFCNLEAEMDIRSIDPNFVKLFKLAQLTIEYLLHSQEYLAGLCASFEEKSKLSEQEVEKVKEEIATLQKELTEVKKESHKRKKLLLAQQQLMFAGNESYNRCPFCVKSFLNNTYLQLHITRRHAGISINNKDGSSSVSPDLGVGSESARNNLENELSQIKEKLLRQEAEIQEERRALQSLKNKDAKILANQVQQILSAPTEILQEEGETGHSSTLMKEIKELNAKLQASQHALKELEARTGEKRSYLGELVDDNENEKKEVKEQKMEIAVLKGQLQQQLDQMKEVMQINLEKQERKWQKKMQRMAQQHATETKKLNNALETTSHSQDGNIGKTTIESQKEVEQLLKQSREREKALEVEAHQLEEEITKTTEIKQFKAPKKSPRSKSLDNVTAQPAMKFSSMYPSDEEKSAGFNTGTSSLQTYRQDTMGTSTMGMTGTRTLHTSQFLEELKKNPSMAVMREQLAELLQELVEKKGIPATQTGITDGVLENKLNLLQTQRQLNVQKYPNFMALREHFNKKATDEAKRQLKMKLSSPRGPPPSELSPRTPLHHQNTSNRPRAGPPHPQQNISNQRTTPRSTSGPAARTQPKPQPQPRAPRTPLSTGSTTEWTSTAFDSDDDSDEEDAPGGQAFTPAPNVRLIQSGPAKGPAGPSPSPRLQGPKPRLIQSRPLNNNADDDIDDILDSDRPGYRVTPEIKKSGSVPNLARAIESQLGARTSDVKPVGGVNLMAPKGGQPKHDVGDFDEESDWESTAPHESVPVPKTRPQIRVSTDGMSTNTYNSSAWGSSSKAASTVKDKERRSTSRSSFVSMTSVSSDDEMNVDNI
ncbi:cilium assembly protein DZIP1L-like isoform X2 [Physella acuta]|uniref:cilium assembly protein DZIP1L-like isoform X2 n=1 Tax=Physella acuta TaxID=109671 RepID=UPI0027DD01B1|nr:cilium assembly protein DZIP1L-like isoform X2 [Physella acuta]